MLAQTAPGTSQLTPALLGQWVENRLGSVRFRAIARIWLGNAGGCSDPASSDPRIFGRLDHRAQLAIHGKIAVDRQNAPPTTSITGSGDP